MRTLLLALCTGGCWVAIARRSPLLPRQLKWPLRLPLGGVEWARSPVTTETMI